MDDDEIFFLFLFSIVSMAALVRWYASIAWVKNFRRGSGTSAAMGVLPLICAVASGMFISLVAAREVRGSPGLIALFTAGEGVVLCAVWFASPMLGLSVRDDVIERRNPAAALAICGGAIAATIAYCGANVGEGATIYTTLGPAILAIAALLALWFIHELVARPSESIAIDRNDASGLRLAGMLIAVGIVLGRAIAGDFHSIDDTVHDFEHLAWPALVIVAVATIVQWRAKRSVSRAFIIAAMYIVAAIAWAAMRGHP